MKSVTSETFEQEVCNSNQPVVVDFWAKWCGPCRYLTPMLHKIEEEQPNVKFVAVDADQNMDLLDRFGIQHIPSVFKFENGHIVAKQIGFVPKQILQQNLGISAKG